MAWTDGRPHVHTPRAMIALAPGDWIVEDLWTHEYLVMSDAEFSARFGGHLAAEG
jgi:hypothetical protein